MALRRDFSPLHVSRLPSQDHGRTGYLQLHAEHNMGSLPSHPQAQRDTVAVFQHEVHDAWRHGAPGPHATLPAWARPRK